MLKALRRFGAPVGDITVNNLMDPELVYQIGVEPTRIDIIMGIDGLDFADCWSRRVEAKWDDIRANFISIDDLIVNKERHGATARPRGCRDIKTTA